MISWRVRQALFLLMAAFVARVEGFTHLLWLWNCVPIVAGYVLLARTRKQNMNPLPAITFFVVACGVSLFAHAAWLYDWNGIATRSSTAGLMSIILPVYACVLGAAAFGLQVLFLGRQ